MPLLNLSRVVNSPYFAQAFTVMRSTGAFAQGGYVDSVCPIGFYGVIQPATDEDIRQVEEGDRTTGMMSFIAEGQMYKTRAKNANVKSGLSDRILWNDFEYKIVSTSPWKDFGFWKAIGSRQP